MRFPGGSGKGLRFTWLAAVVLLLSQNSSHQLRIAHEMPAAERLSGLHIPFIANSGQTDPAVAYYAPTFAGTVFVTRDGRIVYSLPGEKTTTSRARPAGKRDGWSLTETIVGARARPSASHQAKTRVSYFLGNDPSRWRSGPLRIASIC